ncbi:MAG TPA: imidazolonepropionase, partial [Ilumatobacteraceae bacterium]
MTGLSTVVENIGRLITNDAQFEVGATGELRDAWVVFIDGLIESVGTGHAPPADQRIDVGGR